MFQPVYVVAPAGNLEEASETGFCADVSNELFFHESGKKVLRYVFQLLAVNVQNLLKKCQNRRLRLLVPENRG